MRYGLVRHLLCASVIMLVLAPFAFGQDFEIRPGKRIGKVELGMTRREVYRRIGKPVGSYSMPKGLTGEYWMSQTGTGNDVRIIYRNSRVIQIKITSQKFSTPEGVTTASTLEDVTRSYKSLRKSSHFVKETGGGFIDYYDDMRRGIAFEFVSLSMDEPDFKPYAIVVHLPGKRLIPENGEELR